MKKFCWGVVDVTPRGVEGMVEGKLSVQERGEPEQEDETVRSAWNAAGQFATCMVSVAVAEVQALVLTTDSDWVGGAKTGLVLEVPLALA
ncbi:MAG: hypothetical protein E6J62_15735 [Deltaproteobacteria bacterium]|nr:MAG: hypothetical protein E6J62_15735 [Deltaproteobacteria bacterium]